MFKAVLKTFVDVLYGLFFVVKMVFLPFVGMAHLLSSDKPSPKEDSDFLGDAHKTFIRGMESTSNPIYKGQPTNIWPE